jgi:Uma2 family endonuclease
MSLITERQVSLAEFLAMPDTKPASELIDGEIVQKPMPQTEHSRIQYKLCAAINQVAEAAKIACAFPELRCVCGEEGIVPDVAVFRWERMLFEPDGRLAKRFDIYPDWSIEILSPEQRRSKVLPKIINCCQQGTELGWLIDPSEEAIWVVFSDKRIEIFTDDTPLPVPSGIKLSLTTTEIFDWLKFS